MGNCQAVDNATLAIQHPNGRVDKHYFPVSAAEIMKINPGHYVALLLTTTLYSSSSSAAAATSNSAPLRVTRIKLLRPTDTLLLGHVYRLVTSQEVMKGLWAKKQAKMQQPQKIGNVTQKNTISSSDCEAMARKKDDVKNNTTNNNQERQRSRSKTQVNSATSKSRAWQPALKSISEAGT
ncbi:hypothetical protein SASPL_118759 [Salvia splendens]|uniref:DUF4228 domain-containing protein n=1 Tax=Salvia splendens TaxID=180675 RepID=A0A8X8Y201_SALSN|nr:uncharacterized protein LOC121806886 [Salvia splendens]KAG6422195.1 hypothetical protein SASPL_118759 [Salvia splendens]